MFISSLLIMELLLKWNISFYLKIIIFCLFNICHPFEVKLLCTNNKLLVLGNWLATESWRGRGVVNTMLNSFLLEQKTIWLFWKQLQNGQTKEKNENCLNSSKLEYLWLLCFLFCNCCYNSLSCIFGRKICYN